MSTLSYPGYFRDFRCIAGACPDSCCKEWDVLVDPDKAALYRSLPGPLGDRLRQVLSEEDGESYMTIQEGRCPMWRSDGLCRIQAELGEAALCTTCREFPRLTHDYGDFVERGLELSCPVAARLILSGENREWVTETLPGGDEPEYDGEAMAVLKASRKAALSIIDDPGLSPAQAMAALLLYGYQAQEWLDGGEAPDFEPQAALESVRSLAQAGSMEDVFDIFLDLEILSPRWEARLNQGPGPLEWTALHRHLARYFVERYWLQAVSDYDLACRVKFIVISCLMICALGGDQAEAAQQYSKEIENDCNNVEVLLDAAYTSPALTDVKLLGLLLGRKETL